jgi:hypothetical protein
VVTGMIIDWNGVYDNAFILSAGIALIGAVWWAVGGVPKIQQIALD